MRAIDADALMEAINTWPKFGVDERCRIVPWDEGYEPYIHLRDAVIAITGMPTIEERKTGRWIPRYDRPKQEVFICSECGGFAYSLWTGSRKTPKKNWCKYRFCPNCGADMRGDSDD